MLQWARRHYGIVLRRPGNDFATWRISLAAYLGLKIAPGDFFKPSGDRSGAQVCRDARADGRLLTISYITSCRSKPAIRL